MPPSIHSKTIHKTTVMWKVIKFISRTHHTYQLDRTKISHIFLTIESIKKYVMLFLDEVDVKNNTYHNFNQVNIHIIVVVVSTCFFIYIHLIYKIIVDIIPSIDLTKFHYSLRNPYISWELYYLYFAR